MTDRFFDQPILGEDAKLKSATTATYWVPGVNHLATFGRWAFVELTEVYEIESGFGKKVEEAVRLHRENEP